MNINEAALHHERAVAEAAASGRDNPFFRVGVRSDAYDDNGEPLCSEPAYVPASERHHIDTE